MFIPIFKKTRSAVLFSRLFLNFNYNIIYGLEATSHAENLWNVLKDEIKTTYKTIPNKNFLYFLREAEFKYVNRKKNNDELIQEFFECFSLVSNFQDFGFEKDSSFLYNELSSIYSY